MARARTTAQPTPPNGFVSSAVRLPPVSTRAAGRVEGWQNEAWLNYDSVAELHFVATWVGNSMKRARLVPAQREGDALVPISDGPAVEILSAYFDGVQGQAEMMAATGTALTVGGECFHVGINGDTGFAWHVLAPGRVTSTGKPEAQRIYADWGDGRTELKDADLAIRLWSPHPVNPYLADSPVRSNLQTLAEIKSLNDHVQAQLTSRLAGAGVLFLPSEIQFPSPPDSDPAASQADAFMQILGEAMMTPIKDRGNASAVVPIVVTAPGDALDKVQHLTFWTELDGAAIAMREAAVKKLAIGLDTPPEVLLGLSDSSHWNAWLADESAIKSHLEPRLAVVAHAVTTAYLRPSLQGVVGNPEDFYVIADTSAIRLRPNRSREAIELWDRGELSSEAMRRETGFPESDAPTDDDMKQWILRKIATGSTSPEQTQAALRLLGVVLELPGSDTENTEPPGSALPPNLRRHPDTGPPSLPDAEERRDQRGHRSTEPPALVAACEALVFRALERAGNRLCDAKAKANGLGQVVAHERYLHVEGDSRVLLAGAWNIAPQMLSGLVDDDDFDHVVALVDFYARGLVENRAPYRRDTLVRLLASGREHADVEA